ncbi:WD40 repeat-like protein [Hortaea werneckii]|nr:WD40 repeat-like protein [Hortaea werneckii]
MTEVIELSSDSEPDASPDKIRAQALLGFQPRKEKGQTNGEQNTPRSAGISHQDRGQPNRQTINNDRNGAGRRPSHDRQNERRQGGSTPPKRPAYAPNVPGPSRLAHEEVARRGSHTPARLDQDVFSNGKPISGAEQKDVAQNREARVRGFNAFHAQETMRKSQPLTSCRMAAEPNGSSSNGGKASEASLQHGVKNANGANGTAERPRPSRNTSLPHPIGQRAFFTFDQSSAPIDAPLDTPAHRKRPAAPTSSETFDPVSKRQRHAAAGPGSPETLEAPNNSYRLNGGAANLHQAKPHVVSGVQQHLDRNGFASRTNQGTDHGVKPHAEGRPARHPIEPISAAYASPTNQDKAPSSGAKKRFTPDENALLVKLKEVDGLSWREITDYFPGRSQNTLGVHYSTKVHKRTVPIGELPSETSIPKAPQPPPAAPKRASIPVQSDFRRPPIQAPPRRTKRGGGPSAVDGYVSWTQVKDSALRENSVSSREDDSVSGTPDVGPRANQDRIFSQSLPRMLRQRELGGSTGRSWVTPSRRIPEDLKNHAVDGHTLARTFENTCGDVTCLAWSPRGKQFAAGSIAVSDDRSMQYNSGLNLLAGDSESGSLQELPEHHISRPLIDAGSGNVNGLHAMRESQDPRLFMTVASVGFSQTGDLLYSAGGDKKMRAYRMHDDVGKTECCYEIDHAAPIDILSVNNHGVVATACHSGTDGNVRVYRCDDKTFDPKLCLSPSRKDAQSNLPLFPSALKWGVAAQHSNLLLGGFSCDTTDEIRSTAGETALWNGETGQRIALSTTTRNVFDLAWNPSPSAAGTVLAVAAVPGTGKSYRGKQSVVQVYAPDQNRAKQVNELECPAFDINDVTYCPHDENLIAAGATDGKVYIWDMRYTSRNQMPLHTLSHGNSVNVLDHDRDSELADTGVRFLSWGATSSRLYSGSSDGVVKVWNPYRATGGALVKDVATFQTAIMSGAFNHDFRDLLVGEECGRLNLLQVDARSDGDTQSARPQRFKLQNAPRPQRDHREVSGKVAGDELLQSRRIITRPMGALPKWQAVQGPNYDGPYAIAPRETWLQAENDLKRAQDAQNDAHSTMDIDSSQTSEHGTAIRDADNRVKAAQMAIERLQIRHDDAVPLMQQAAENQRKLCREEKKRMQLEASLAHPTECCKLDCNFLPRDDDIGLGVPDSRRSEQRIPAALRRLPKGPVNLAEMDCKQLSEFGLAGKCPHCERPAKSTALRAHFTVLCQQRCASIRAAFTGTCDSCSALARSETRLCERCAFNCFRCGERAQLLPPTTDHGEVVYCDSCGSSWAQGVLGYELVQDASQMRMRVHQNTTDEDQEGLAEDGPVHLEEGETMHHHLRWET